VCGVLFVDVSVDFFTGLFFVYLRTKAVFLIILNSCPVSNQNISVLVSVIYMGFRENKKQTMNHCIHKKENNISSEGSVTTYTVTIRTFYLKKTVHCSIQYCNKHFYSSSIFFLMDVLMRICTLIHH